VQLSSSGPSFFDKKVSGISEKSNRGENLVKPPSTPDFPQLAHSAEQINRAGCPVYPSEVDIIDLEAEKIESAAQRAALFVFLGVFSAARFRFETPRCGGYCGVSSTHGNRSNRAG
jgi:hypothetical protein